MKTQELIRCLAADGATTPPSVRLNFASALGLGALLALTAMLLTLGARPDFAAALHTWRFTFKFLVTGLLGIMAVRACRMAWRPDAHFQTLDWMSVLAAPAILLGAVGVELGTVPHAVWLARLVGSNSMVCLMAIPALALTPLALLLFVMRQGAPRSPVGAGALAGLASAAIAATAYAAHCPDDSPLFVAVWYTLGTLLVVAAGALAGRTWLRW